MEEAERSQKTQSDVPLGLGHEYSSSVLYRFSIVTQASGRRGFPYEAMATLDRSFDWLEPPFIYHVFESEVSRRRCPAAFALPSPGSIDWILVVSMVQPPQWLAHFGRV